MSIHVKVNGAWKDVEAKSASSCEYHIATIKVKTYGTDAVNKNQVASVTSTVFNTFSGNTQMSGIVAGKCSSYLRTVIPIDCGFTPRIVLPYYYGGSWEQGATYGMLNPVMLTSPDRAQNIHPQLNLTDSSLKDRYLRMDVVRAYTEMNSDGSSAGTSVLAKTNQYFLLLYTHYASSHSYYFKVIAFK